MAFNSANDPASIHKHYLAECLVLAKQSPPKPTNFRVGSLLLLRRQAKSSDTTKPSFDDKIISTGYTLELPGNTHAEQSCLKKLTAKHEVFEEQVGRAIKRECDEEKKKSKGDAQVVLYVTMEPCGKRLSGNAPCVERIIQAGRSEDGIEGCGIDMVYFGVKEPGTFVGESQGCKMLTEAGVKWEHVAGMEDEILAVAMEGHKKKDEDKAGEIAQGQVETNVDDISEEERKRQDEMPRNPKKRMMEV